MITVFPRSLARRWKGTRIAVIVSGHDGDGAAASRSIKDAGGITIARKPETAQRRDMPESVIAAGWIDSILSPENIAREIGRIAHDDG